MPEGLLAQNMLRALSLVNKTMSTVALDFLWSGTNELHVLLLQLPRQVYEIDYSIPRFVSGLDEIPCRLV
jgi:hypothetical protein